MNRCTIGVCVVCLAVMGFSRAEPPAENEAAPAPPARRLDQRGDPLPEGAIARFGTIRWRLGGYVSSLSFSPNGKTLASASNDDTVRLWDVDSGKEIRRFVGNEHSWMTSVVFSPDGKTLATAGADKLMRLYEAATAKLIRTFKGHTGTVRCLAFSPDGKMLASGADWNGPKGQITMRLWEVSSGKELAAVRHKGDVRSVAFTRDGKGVVRTVAQARDRFVDPADPDNGVWLWDVNAGKEVRRFPSEKQRGFTCVAVSPDGQLVAGGGERDELEVFVWETVSGKEVHRFRGQGETVTTLAFSLDGKHLAAGYDSRGVKRTSPVILWDVKTKKEVKRLGESSLYVSSLTFSPNSQLIVVGSGGVIRLWDLLEDKELFRHAAHQGDIASIAIAPDGKTACTFGYDGTVRLWDARTGAERRLIARIDDYPRAVAFADGGKHVVAVSSNTFIWDTETGKELRRFDSGSHAWFGALSANGQLVAMRSSDRDKKGVILWQTATGKQLASVGDNHAHRVSLSPDGSRIATYRKITGRGAGLLQVWETATGKLLHESRLSSDNKEGDDTQMAGFTADGGKLLLHGDDRLYLLDVNTGKKGRQIPLDRDDAHTIAVSPDGKWLAASERLGPIRVFNLESGKGTRLKGHQDGGAVMVFSPDSKTLFSGGGDTTVLVWDLSAIQLSHPESAPIDYLWWIIAACLSVIALAVLWKILSFFRGRWLQSA